MDRTSELTDDLVIKVLSFLPTKVAVSTSILSKRWECLWMWLPKLEYVCVPTNGVEYKRLRRFLNRSLLLHKAPVIESFRLSLLISSCKPEDINLCVVFAVSRYLRELEIEYSIFPRKPQILPSSLYDCKSLVILKLFGGIRFDFPRRVCLPSLKTLHLRRNKYLDGESLGRLLSICSVLEDILVEFCDSDNTGLITVRVLSLQIFSLDILIEGCVVGGLVIDTPSLKYLKLEISNADIESHSCVIENMPKLEEAYVVVRFPDISSLT